MSYMADIGRLSEQNIGGIVDIQVARIGDILSIPEPVDGVIYGNITFQSGKGFSTWYPTSQSAKMIASDRVSQEGNYKTNRLPFIIAKENKSIKALFEQAQGDKFVVLYKDANGKQKLFGTLAMPVRFEFSHDSSDLHAGRNSYSCQFIYEGPDNTFFYDGSISTPPSGPAPVVIQWNGVTQVTANPGDVVNVVSEFKIDDFEVNINVT